MTGCSSCGDSVKPKLRVYYKYSLLNQKVISFVNNIKKVIAHGYVYNDFNCTNKIGKIMYEQIINENIKKTKSTVTIYLPSGDFTYGLLHPTNNGKSITNTNIVGHLIQGTKSFLLWNSPKYFVNVFPHPDNDTYVNTVYTK